jgi:hypothetical protein
MSFFASRLLACDWADNTSLVVRTVLAESSKSDLLSLTTGGILTASSSWTRLGVWEALHTGSINENNFFRILALWLEAFGTLFVWSGELFAGLASTIGQDELSL